MARVLIIACGNPLRSDDGVAWRAAEDLSHRNLPGNVEVLTCQQLTPELAAPVSEASIVVFIDAARTGVPGEVVCTTLELRCRSSPFSHELAPEAILRAAQELYGRGPEAFLISVSGECFAHGETLSPAVAANLPRVAALVGELVRPSGSKSFQQP